MLSNNGRRRLALCPTVRSNERWCEQVWLRLRLGVRWLRASVVSNLLRLRCCLAASHFVQLTRALFCNDSGASVARTARDPRPPVGKVRLCNLGEPAGVAPVARKPLALQTCLDSRRRCSSGTISELRRQRRALRTPLRIPTPHASHHVPVRRTHRSGRSANLQRCRGGRARRRAGRRIVCDGLTHVSAQP